MKLNHLFTYLGPNWRSDRSLAELCLSYNEQDQLTIIKGSGSIPEKIHQELEGIGISVGAWQVEFAEESSGPIETFGRLCADIAILLQTVCGHKVNERGYLSNDDLNKCSILFEHDEDEVGRQAGILALTILDRVFSGLEIDLAESAHDLSIQDLHDKFKSHAAIWIQPPDTGAILQAAKSQDVPVLKLERGLYEPVQGDHRIRMNSMLMLGHCARRQIIDGTFALEKSARAYSLITDRQRIMHAAAQLKIPVPPAYRNRQPMISLRRAERAAREVGYPVVVRTSQRGGRKGTTLDIRDKSQLAVAVKLASEFDGHFIVEGYIKGDPWVLLVAGHELMAVLTPGRNVNFTGEVHPSILDMVVGASRSLHVGLLAVSIVTPDISNDLNSAGGAVVDLDVAPRLDELLGKDSPLMQKASDNFVRWLIPGGPSSRVPIIAVTGSNGKTTTTRMISHTIQQTCRVVGMQCTDGRYINKKQVTAVDESTMKGHDQLLHEKSVQVAVLESHHKGLAQRGFSFDWCDIGICTNVTEEHLGESGLETMDELVKLKRSLLERVRYTAILNVDCENCRSMTPFINADRTCLTSMDQSAGELSSLFGSDTYCCVIEDRDGIDWIVIYDLGDIHDVIPVQDIPATFGGLARFNVMNAMQAIMACYAEGVTLEVIRDAMSSFSMSVENTPWRLNFYQGLPFQVMVDFAHNPDGMKRVAEFTDGIQIPGRKIVAFSGYKSDERISKLANVMAGHYDHYVLKNYGPRADGEVRIVNDPLRVTNVMKRALLDSNVMENRISTVYEEMEAVEYTLNMADEGDLVVLLLGYAGMEKIEIFMQQYIDRHNSAA